MFEELKPHIQDLRKRLIIALLSVLVCFFACFAFWKQIFIIVKTPIELAFHDRVQGTLMQLTPLEGIFSAMSLSFLAALVLAMPIIFWQLWLFIAPGLYKHEKRILLPFVLFGSSMFVCGALFAYYVVFPFMIEYILLFGNDMFEANISVESYVGFFIRVVLGFGIAFELPVLAFFLAKVGMITDASLKGFFKYAVVIIFIIAAIITPPDPFSQLLMAVPLVLLYALSILIAKMINPANDMTKPSTHIKHADAHTDANPSQSPSAKSFASSLDPALDSHTLSFTPHHEQSRASVTHSSKDSTTSSPSNATALDPTPLDATSSYKDLSLINKATSHINKATNLTNKDKPHE